MRPPRTGRRAPGDREGRRPDPRARRGPAEFPGISSLRPPPGRL